MSNMLGFFIWLFAWMMAMTSFKYAFAEGLGVWQSTLLQILGGILIIVGRDLDHLVRNKYK